MALTLTVEDGSQKADANTYISLADADTYFEGRLSVSTWTGADDATKNAALVQAARILDSYISWLGYKTDADQAMQWPRWGICYHGSRYYECPGEPQGWIYALESDTVPQEIRDAQCELALVLISQDTQAVSDTAGYSQISVEGAVDLQVNPGDRVKEIPGHVFSLVSHLGTRKGTNTRLVRA
jgi:hypothetical protein